MADAWLRVVDRLPAPSLAALCAAWPEVLAGLARDVPVTMSAGWGWERPREVDRIMRMRPGVVKGERTA